MQVFQLLFIFSSVWYFYILHNQAKNRLLEHLFTVLFPSLLMHFKVVLFIDLQFAYFTVAQLLYISCAYFLC